MKLIRRNNLKVQEAEKLIEKYYEGDTSVEEENLLRAFLSQNNVPEQFETEKVIFGYFESKKSKKSVFFISNYMKWAASAVAVIAIVVSMMFSNQSIAANYAYVDGQKITDMQIVQKLAQTSISNIASKNTELETGLENIRSSSLIESQLDVFSGVEF